ncbi:MAG: hypothetical protein HYT87_13945 [Nitrospirae bacterium]|nr:hypothetical protein [Nitrospirota bacterium]
MEWELPAEAMYLEFEKLPYGREVFKVGEADAERLTSQVKAILEVLEEAPSPSPAPERAGEAGPDFLAPRRALQCEADNPCQTDQSKCENRVACLQKTWKTTPPPCLGPRMRECFQKADPNRVACASNQDDSYCGAGYGGHTNGQTDQSVICKENRQTDRGLEISIFHELVHQCEPAQPPLTPLDAEEADRRATSCEARCFEECGSDPPDPEFCGKPGVGFTPGQCEL